MGKGDSKTALVQFSTGAGSAYVAYRAIENYGRRNVVLMTANTMVEDDDNWRFAHEVWMDLGQPEWVILADGRTPMQVGRDMRIVPNNRMAVCSRVLKRELIRRYIEERYQPDNCVVMLGFDWTEEHRLVKALPHWDPWEVAAPLMDPPYIDKAMILDFLKERGIEPPRLYAQGFSHANCGGACVRGGHAQWKLLLEVNRPLYIRWEIEEFKTRKTIGKDVAILRDRTGGKSRPMTLREFRDRIDGEKIDVDPDDWGACGCFMDEDGEVDGEG